MEITFGITAGRGAVLECLSMALKKHSTQGAQPVGRGCAPAVSGGTLLHGVEGSLLLWVWGLSGPCHRFGEARDLVLTELPGVPAAAGGVGPPSSRVCGGPRRPSGLPSSLHPLGRMKPGQGSLPGEPAHSQLAGGCAVQATDAISNSPVAALTK